MEPLNLYRLLESNPYPGRGIVLGRSADNRFAVAAYFIMGRSENSRNRVFLPTEDGIRTQAHDPSKMTDPRLCTPGNLSRTPPTTPPASPAC